MSASLFSLRGKTALITGGTRGIGAAIAIGLAEAGADIILIQRDPNNMQTRDTILSLSRRCEIVISDLSHPTHLEYLLPRILSNITPKMAYPPPPSSTIAENGTLIDPITVPIPNNAIHILINAAGIQARYPATDFPLAEFQRVLDTNLTATFVLCRDMGRYWVERGIKGRIVNVGSLLQFQGGLTVLGYTASKGGVAQITKGFSNEWAGRGIGVNAIAPGYVSTEMNTALIGDPVRSRQIMERIPAGRWGRPEDFKGPAVFLCSDAAAYVSGETLVVDGGWMGR
ncbi:NAD(P)-binding protein [Ascobolus immersus RN42]|uniref:NAD(P)-binding protein n=1 Tax=Ascobolus immersus RN42 TaxID=1160509 RepID=A0A3N4HJI2_ASCIM|nr:NAD(P)-binding protein [Ascobolus immersus RN42]